MTVESLKSAHQAFCDGNYNAALRAYLRLKEIYKTRSFDLNIRICRKRLCFSSQSLQLFHPRSSCRNLEVLNDFFDHIYLVNLDIDVNSRIRAEYCLVDHNINFSTFSATDGCQGEPLLVYNTYINGPVGSLNKFSKYNDTEIKRGSKFIESPGAVGYIFTYRRILQDAISKGYQSILILEDDVAFVDNASSRIKDFLAKLPSSWKILHLGSSQYGWDNIRIERARQNGFYYPSPIQTCGSFAIGINHFVFNEIIELISHFESPFDLLPLGEIYESSVGKCFCAFPSIAIPDVSQSYIRPSRNQIAHSARMKWPIESIEYPFCKPLLQVLLSDSTQLKYASSFNRFYERGYILNFYKYSDGFIRPVHCNNYIPFKTLAQDKSIFEQIKKRLSSSKLWITKKDNSPFVEEDFHEHLLKSSHFGYIEAENIEDDYLKYIPGRASIVIPTYGRSGHLRFAIDSCLDQSYSDIEIIVVSDNGDTSQIEAVKLIEASYKSHANLKFFYHSSNINGSAARNTGALRSTGEYISFLDDDNIYLPGRIEETVQLLSSLPSYYGGVYCGYLGWKSNTLDEARFTEEDLFKKILLLDHSSHFVHTNTVTVRRTAFFAVNGFNEAYSRHQDLEYHLRILMAFKLKPVPKLLVQLKPNKVDNSNILSVNRLKEIKKAFLNDFSKEILELGDDFASQVWNAHQNDLLRYSPCKDKPITLPPLF